MVVSLLERITTIDLVIHHVRSLNVNIAKSHHKLLIMTNKKVSLEGKDKNGHLIQC